MRANFSPNNNPRVIIIQKLYGKFFNKEEILEYPNHRFKKFIINIIIKEYLDASNFFIMISK